MNILHTVPLYSPCVGGSEEVVKQISERLARRGYTVTVATAANPSRRERKINGVTIEEFSITGNAVRGMRGEIDRYRRYVLRARMDVIMNYASICWTTDLILPLLDRISVKKVFVPCGYLLADQRYAAYYQKLPAYLTSYDALVYMSKNYQDKKFGDQHGLGQKSVIIPNATGAEEFLKPPLDFKQRYGITTKHLLLCVANHYPAKGHAFVIKAFRQLRRKDTTLVIIGNPIPGVPPGCYWSCKARARLQPSIKVLTNVPRPWVVSAFQEADLFVFGSHIECAPLVIIEAMAARLPFITTDCGNVRDYQEYGEIVNTPEAMANAIERFLNDDTLHHTIGQKAFAAWREHHTWDIVVTRYEQLYTKLVTGRDASSNKRSNMHLTIP